MVKWLNSTFGIENEVSVPILISLIVFIIGGIASYLFAQVKGFTNRRNSRTTFNLLLQEVISDLKIKENHTSEFFPTIIPEHSQGWGLKYTTVRYLETFFELDFTFVFYSFRKKLFWKFETRKLGNKAFHRVWAVLRNLKFIDERIEVDLDNFIQRFAEFHKQYNTKLEDFRRMNEDILTQYNGHIPETEVRLLSFLNESNDIWRTWKEIDESKRVAYFRTNTFLVKPLLKLYLEYDDWPFVKKLINPLLECQHAYMEIENTLKIYRSTFKNHAWNYRSSRRILKKSFAILE